MKRKLLDVTAGADMPELALAFPAEEEREQWQHYHAGVGRVPTGFTRCSRQVSQPGLDPALLRLQRDRCRTPDICGSREFEDVTPKKVRSTRREEFYFKF